MIIGHKRQWNFLKSAIEGNHLPQAFLFEGEENLGKKKVAFEFIKTIFCENIEEAPCQNCQSCLLIEKNNHPDFIFIAPQKREIKIDQIRELQNKLSLRPTLSKTKAIVINDAHCLNIQAQNCFLKTLEEPKSQTIFILISSLPNILLGTIQSRCESLKFYPLAKEDIEQITASQEILHYSLGKPGKAISFLKNQNSFNDFQNSLKIAKEFLTKDLLSKFLFIKEFFPKDKEDSKNEESSLLLESMIWHLRKALWIRVEGDVNKNALLKTKKAIELTEEAKMLLQTTNVSPRLLLENLILNF
ncbi:MAG: DNA polymerase III subunit delta' [bacterium]|nr:DNA polymerase III subunit delta' [bacterium]